MLRAFKRQTVLVTNTIRMIEGDRHSAVVARHLGRRCWCAPQHRGQLCTSVQLAGVDSWLWLPSTNSWTGAEEDLSECVTTRAQADDTTKHNAHTTNGAAVHTKNTILLWVNDDSLQHVRQYRYWSWEGRKGRLTVTGLTQTIRGKKIPHTVTPAITYRQVEQHTL